MSENKRNIARAYRSVYIGEGKGKKKAARVCIYYDPLLCEAKTIGIITQDTAEILANFIADDLNKNERKHN